MNERRETMNELREKSPPDGLGDETRQSPVAALLTRTMSMVYDLLLLIAVLFIVTAAALFANDGKAFGAGWLLVGLAIGWLFFDWFWRHGGQTLGMRAWRLKLVGDDGRPLTRGRTLVRYALGCLLFGITFLVIPFDPQRRAMHDRLTRTRVVRLSKEA